MQVETSRVDSSGVEDRVQPLTRIVAALVIPFLVAAFVILYFFPEESGQRFAWRIQPPMSAAWMGAGYLGGAYFFLRVLLERRWHRVSAGFWAVTAFTWGMLLVTVLHWSRFDLGHVPFQIWLVLYVVTPFLVPYLWWRNRDADDGALEAEDVLVPAWARAGMGAIGLGMGISCLVAFVAPGMVISFWPWALTPLTARVMGGWFALMGAGGFMMAREKRWSGWRYGLESIIFIWHGLVLLAAFLHPADLQPGGSWFVVAEGVAVVSLFAFYLRMRLAKAKQG